MIQSVHQVLHNNRQHLDTLKKKNMINNFMIQSVHLVLYNNQQRLDTLKTKTDDTFVIIWEFK